MCLQNFHMASPLLLVDHGAAATAVQKKACRATAAYAAFAATTAAGAASAVLLLLLCCCCCHIRVPLLRVAIKTAVLRDASRSFLFSIRDLYFLVIWWNFGDSLIANTVKVMPEWIWPFSSSKELLFEWFLSQTLSINNHIVRLVHKKHIIQTCLMYQVPRSLQPWVSTIQIVLTADVFLFSIKKCTANIAFWTIFEEVNF